MEIFLLLLLIIPVYWLFKNQKIDNQTSSKSNDSIKTWNNSIQNNSNNKKLQSVRNSNYTKKSILNKTEQNFFYNLLSFLDTKKYGVFAQVPVYALVNCQPTNNIHTAGSKYFDFIIFNRSNFKPICAIEVHGKGHNNANNPSKTVISDRLKEEIMLSADIRYHCFYDEYMESTTFIKQELEYLS